MTPVHDVLSVLLGSLVGFSLGLIGGGGSILTVPLLVYVIGESVSAAIGTSLAIVGLNSLAGFLGHWRYHRVHLKTGLIFGGAGTVGAFFGTWLGHFLPAREVLFLFSLVMISAAIIMLHRAGSGAATEPPNSSEERYGMWDWGKVLAAGVGVGVLTGLFGVGGGFVIIPALVIVLGIPMRFALGTSLLIITMNCIAGLIAHLQYGGISVMTTILFVCGGLLGTVAGTRLAGRMPESRLQQVFAFGVVAVAVYLAFKAHPVLL
jgi:uncharacterized protein